MAISNTIGSTLKTALGSNVKLRLDEGKLDDMPYAVYVLDMQELRTKSGVYAIKGTMTISCYADTYASAKQMAGYIKSAMATSLRTAEYRNRLTSESATCEDGVWLAQLEYNVAQYQVE